MAVDEMVVWLREQIAEDRTWAQQVILCDYANYSAKWELVASASISTGDGFVSTDDRVLAGHIIRWDPARVLAECEAKEALTDAHPTVRGWHVLEPNSQICGTCATTDLAGDLDGEYPCLTLRLLALPYAGRPGYRQEWRP